MAARQNEEKTSPKKRVLIVDDHEIVRQGLSMLIEQTDDLSPCGQADTPDSALKAIEKTSPDVALVDITLKDGNGIELIKDIRIRYPQLPVLVLSMHEEALYAERVLRAGARGYITKENAGELVVAAIRKVLDGEMFVSEHMATRMLSKFIDGRPERGSSPADLLSDRELQVFELLGMGMSTSDIAKRLHLSAKTIGSHRENIKRKLKFDNASELLQQAIRWVQTTRGS